ncbi:MAG: gamma-glutamyl-gamma-aminobutyrate hydrolase family protein [Bacteroidales bacterium]|nr:gamma-glutamyl-gamma-aminobutyrate hydrolase family protein [Bacteroidales bacterium]
MWTKLLCKILCFPVWFALLLGCKSEPSKVRITVNDMQDSANTVVIMHPTVNTIRTVMFLVDNDILELSPDTRFVGVFHSNESYDYRQSDEYIANRRLNNFSLLPIVSPLDEGAIYRTNDCSILFEHIFRQSKAVLFFGGPDIPPACYGEATNLLTQITDPHRHYMELSFLFHLLGGSQDTVRKALLESNPRYPILGICLGMQSINVATGGSLTQDIPTEIYKLSTVDSVLALVPDMQHKNYYNSFAVDSGLLWGCFHRVNFIAQPFISLASRGAKPFVLSSHHQCIKRLGRDILVAGMSDDGMVIEAITHARFPNVMGVQFHPEPSFLYSPNDTIRVEPAQLPGFTYVSRYAADGGAYFHRNFWNYFGNIIE